MNKLISVGNVSVILKENEAMNSLLIERDEEIEKLKKEVARLKASNKRWYNIYKDLRKEKG